MATPDISRGTSVKAAVRNAGRRRLLVLSLRELALAVGLVLAGCLPILLLGTQILEWYWLTAFAALGLGVALFRLRKNLLPPYQVAQIIDRRLSLQDSISTAWFCSVHPENSDSAVAAFNIQRADRIAASIDPAHVFPLSGGREWLLTAVLAMAVAGLFGVRYLVTNSLNFRPALIPLEFSVVLETLIKPFSPHKATTPIPVDSNDRNPALPQSGKSDVPHARPNESNAESSTEAQAAAPMNAPKNGARGQERSDGKDRSQASGGRPDSSSAANSDPNNPSQAKPGDTKETGAKDSAQQQASSGLMDKMKDALNSLMAKMRPNSALQNAQHGSDRSSQQQTASEQNASKAGQSATKNTPNDQASNEQNTEGQAPGQTVEKAQSTTAHGSDQTSDKNSSDSQSGVGRQDGQKDLKEAEQLQAMGKLAEIIGKRSANVSGDITLETPSGKQRLQTDYSARVGHHADSGGEINRNEVPLMYQQYIREYMDRVHKQAAASEK